MIGLPNIATSMGTDERGMVGGTPGEPLGSWLTLTTNANGNLTAKGANTFSYDQANRLKSATVAGASETYAYDGDGLRFSRTVGANPAIRYVSDVNTSLPVTLDDGSRKYVYGLGLAYAVNGTSLEIYHTDRLGSVRAITDATGTVTATYRTDEFGVPTATTGPSSQPFRFSGEPLDATGLIYLRARSYDPSLGRFVERDALGGRLDAAAQSQPLLICGWQSNRVRRPIGPQGTGARSWSERREADADTGSAADPGTSTDSSSA